MDANGAHISPVNVFVSSTFVDLVEEFQYLHSSTFPQLDEICRQYGTFFAPYDHRRTAVDYRSSSDFILKHALDGIQHCGPYFMCIIGSQYGEYSLPTPSSPNVDSDTTSRSSINRNISYAISHGYPNLSQFSDRPISLLELEVQFASLMKTTVERKQLHSHFYIQDPLEILKRKQSNTSTSTTSQFSISEEQSFPALLEAEDEVALERLMELKTEICESGLPIKFFASKEELEEAILQDWMEILFTAFQNVPKDSVHERELNLNLLSTRTMTDRLNPSFHIYREASQIKKLMNNHVETAKTTKIDAESKKEFIDKSCVKGDKLGDGVFSSAASLVSSFKRIEEAKNNAEKSIFLVTGEPGSGKTALVIDWLKTVSQEQPETLVIPFLIGSSYLTFDLSFILRTCIHTIRKEYWRKKCTARETMVDLESFSVLSEAFEAALQLVPCIIVIDGINDLVCGMDQDIGSIKGLEWLPSKLPPSCRLIITSRSSDLTYQSLMNRCDVTHVKMPTPPLDTRKDIFAHCSGEANDIVGKEAMEKVWMNRLSTKPLYLRTLADLIKACRTRNEMLYTVDKCSTFRSFRDFWRSVFWFWSKRHSWNKQSSGQPGSIRQRTKPAGWVADALKLIAVSRGGLSQSEILHLLFLMGYNGRATVTPHDWSMFMTTAGCALYENHVGLISFSHRDTEMAVSYLMLGKGNYGSSKNNVQSRLHSLLASYFLTHGTMERKYIELLWQLRESNDVSKLCQQLSKPRYLLSLCSAAAYNPALYVDIVMFWKYLSKHDFEIRHCVENIIQQALDEKNDPDGSEDKSQIEIKSAAVRSPIAIVPSLIVTSHGDSEHAFPHKRSEESRSETDLGDVSETDTSSLLYINDAMMESSDAHLQIIRGWSPRENNPEIRVGLIEEDDIAHLHYALVWMLTQMGHQFVDTLEFAVDQLRTCLNELPPSSSMYALNLFLLTYLQCCTPTTTLGEEQLLIALDLYEDIMYVIVDQPTHVKMFLIEAKGMIMIKLASILTDLPREGEEAFNYVVAAIDLMKCCNSTKGLALASRVYGELLAKRGIFDDSDQLLEKSLTTLCRWHGMNHIDVAYGYNSYGDYHRKLAQEKETSENNRRAMLLYKDALKIFKDKKNLQEQCANMYEKIGDILSEENNLRSKEEAFFCMERAKDLLILLRKGDQKRLTSLYKKYKRMGSELNMGRYSYGKAKPLDTRDDMRPVSAMSWHVRQLNSEMFRRSRTASAATTRSKMETQSQSGKQRPYSPFCTSSLGSRVLTSRLSKRDYTAVAPTKENINSEARSQSSNGRSSPSTPPSENPRLSLTVHGPHSCVEHVLDPPPSPRPNVFAATVHHKSAWYNVPGRYAIRGETLPKKRSQKRVSVPKLIRPHSTPITNYYALDTTTLASSNTREGSIKSLRVS